MGGEHIIVHATSGGDNQAMLTPTPRTARALNSTSKQAHLATGLQQDLQAQGFKLPLHVLLVLPQLHREVLLGVQRFLQLGDVACCGAVYAGLVSGNTDVTLESTDKQVDPDHTHRSATYQTQPVCREGQ